MEQKRTFLWCLLVTMAGAAGPAGADPGNALLSIKVKAAYLLNFARFTTWPDDALHDKDDAKAPIVIVVLGDDDAGMAATLSALVKKEKVHDRSVVVRQFDFPDEKETRRQQEAMKALQENLRRAHLLYIDSSLQDDVPSVLQLIDNAHLLTTSECTNFAADGGMLGFIEKDGKIVFEANPDVIDKSDVDVSSKILRLAQIVNSKEH